MFESLEPEYPKKFYLTKFDLYFFVFTFMSGVPLGIDSLVKNDFQWNFSFSWSCFFSTWLIVCLVISLCATAQIVRIWKNRIPVLTITRNGFQSWNLFSRVNTYTWDEIKSIKSQSKKAIVFFLREDVIAKRYLADKSKFKYIFRRLIFRKNTITVGRPSLGNWDKKVVEQLLRSYNEYGEEQRDNEGTLRNIDNIVP